MISPTAFKTAFPVAPDPEPPQKTTLGVPHASGPNPKHPLAPKKAALASILKLKSFKFSGILSTPTVLSTIPLAA